MDNAIRALKGKVNAVSVVGLSLVRLNDPVRFAEGRTHEERPFDKFVGPRVHPDQIVFIPELPPWMKDNIAIRGYFSRFGPLISVTIGHAGHGRNTAFLTFHTISAARRACEAKHSFRAFLDSTRPTPASTVAAVDAGDDQITDRPGTSASEDSAVESEKEFWNGA